MKTEIRLSIEERTPFTGGMEFGTTGPYERIKGRVHFAVDPGEQAYSGITDLDQMLKPKGVGESRIVQSPTNGGHSRESSI